jgi:DNA-binding transcriptional regulator YbjK
MTTDSTRQRIIDATLECIGKHGIQAVTNRRIAQLANVNCAAINYYFSSKEKLMNEAIEYSMDNYLGEFFRHPLTKERTGNSQLKKFLSESLSDAIASPHIIK